MAMLSRLFGSPTNSEPPAAPNQPASPAAASPLDSAVQSVAMDLIPVRDADIHEVTVLNIGGLKFGNRSYEFDFSIRHMKEKVPVEAKALGQLAVGCRRALMQAFERRSSIVKELTTKKKRHKENPRINPKLTKEESRMLSRTSKELAAFNHIHTFTFETNDGQPTLVIEGTNPTTGKDVKLTLKLDPDYNGAAQVVQETLIKFKSKLTQYEFDLNRMNNIVAAGEAQLNHLQVRLREAEEAVRSATSEGAVQVIDPSSATQLQSIVTDLQRQVEESNQQVSNAQAQVRKFEEEKRQEIAKLKAQITALRNANQHRIKIKEHEDDNGQTYYTPTIELLDITDSEAKVFDRVEITSPETRLLYFGGQVKTHDHIFEDITAGLKGALEGTTNKARAFQLQIQQMQEKKARRANTSPQSR